MRNFQSGDRKLLDETFKVLREYLKSCGWRENDLYISDGNFGQLVDPITFMSHSLDYAYTLQTERNLIFKSMKLAYNL